LAAPGAALQLHHNTKLSALSLTSPLRVGALLQAEEG
jgi:hypothetical protein